MPWVEASYSSFVAPALRRGPAALLTEEAARSRRKVGATDWGVESRSEAACNVGFCLLSGMGEEIDMQ